MTPERRIKLELTCAKLSQDEIKEGWHFCPAWDFMLVGPGCAELDGCVCKLDRANMRILQLTLKKKWFDLIASGDKVFEYREYKQHWMSRLIGKNGTRDYDEVRFTNGYGSNRPYIRVEFIGVIIMKGKYCNPDHSEPLEPENKYFVIGLGKVLEIG